MCWLSECHFQCWIFISSIKPKLYTLILVGFIQVFLLDQFLESPEAGLEVFKGDKEVAVGFPAYWDGSIGKKSCDAECGLLQTLWCVSACNAQRTEVGGFKDAILHEWFELHFSVSWFELVHVLRVHLVVGFEESEAQRLYVVDAAEIEEVWDGDSDWLREPEVRLVTNTHPEYGGHRSQTCWELERTMQGHSNVNNSGSVPDWYGSAWDMQCEVIHIISVLQASA